MVSTVEIQLVKQAQQDNPHLKEHQDKLVLKELDRNMILLTMLMEMVLLTVLKKILELTQITQIVMMMVLLMGMKNILKHQTQELVALQAVEQQEVVHLAAEQAVNSKDNLESKNSAKKAKHA